ncbi:uncharacterized protein JN550_003165 [Neoarthrinium moseri]|uniref:uncharacterized protein n=1 Tax=Neoarthrinium moseri TaxID=1658444 RepID=UPI001FDE66D3|nr:uncharacterized protein JN550_003165 [Neoarthrinium moseri]KAI1873896.1 hypothetical protein JN550_003165 [Neoarthrinium moseri]
MSDWTTPTYLLPDKTATTGTPALVTFAGEVWCFWVHGKLNNISYTATTRTGWTEPTIVDNSIRDPDTREIASGAITPYQVHATRSGSGKPLLAAASAGAILHLMFTSTTKSKDEEDQSYLYHLVYNAELKTWGRPARPADGRGVLMDVDPTLLPHSGPLALGITDGLNLLHLGNELQVAWLDADGTRRASVYQDYAWKDVTLSNNEGIVKPVSAMATLSERCVSHVLAFSSETQPKLIDFIAAIGSGKAPAAPEVRQDGIPSGFSTSEISACSFQEIGFYALLDPSTGKFKLFEFSDKSKPREYPGPEPAISDTVPAIEVAKNKFYCVWTDRKKKTLLFSVKPSLVIAGTMDRWMTYLPSDTRISRLTIPGTHDSGAMSRIPFVGCQMTTIRQQLESGIRYFDLRGGYGLRGEYTYPVVHHNVVPILVKTLGSNLYDIPSWFDGLKVEDVFNTFYQFLKDNPGEGLIVQIKRDELDIENKLHDDEILIQFANDIWALTQKEEAGGCWIVESGKIPTLKELRGKIQLVRRFVEGMVVPDQRPEQRKKSYGVPVLLQWQDNAKDTALRPTNGVNVRLQDYFDLSWKETGLNPTREKWNVIRPMLNAAWQAGQSVGQGQVQNSGSTEDTWFLNFASGVQAPKKGASISNVIGSVVSIIKGQAHSIATGFWFNNWFPIVDPYGINAMLLDYFNDPIRQKGGYGTIVMDFPEQPSDLVPALVRTNFTN